jgi:hypothetical protein
MARVRCSVQEIELTNEDDHDVESVMATCSRCKHTTESFGTSEASVRRCLVLMREECPRKENNFYVDDAEVK